MRPLRRVEQFLGALRARVDPDERAAIHRWLSPLESELFEKMTTWDQRHCLNVRATLYGAGCRDDALLHSALLHDAGKSLARITVWHRAAQVLLASFLPGLWQRLTDGDVEMPGWRRPWRVARRHAALGAEMAGQAGCPAAVQEYIRQHHQPITEGPVAWLRWADGQILFPSTPYSEEVKPCPASPLSERAS